MGNVTISFTSAITAITIFFQCLFGINGLGFGKVALALEQERYPVSAETIEAVLYNCTCEPIPIAPYFYSLEHWESGGWAPVARKESVVIPIAMALIHPFHSANRAFYLRDYDPLPAGRYRLTASGSAYAEFELV